MSEYPNVRQAQTRLQDTMDAHTLTAAPQITLGQRISDTVKLALECRSVAAHIQRELYGPQKQTEQPTAQPDSMEEHVFETHAILRETVETLRQISDGLTGLRE